MADSPLDWFVAPDAKSGDGSREKPFHDPWLALRAAGPGDTLHIAAGTYLGRFERSSWIVDSPRLTLLGGYSRDFAQRTPWKTPSIFAALPGYEAVRENNFITGHTDHSGLTLDGLFFDGAGRNAYTAKPAEELQSFAKMEGALASFNAKNVTIRNCIFANSATGGVELSGDGSRFENNWLVNILGLAMLDLRGEPENQTQMITVANNSFCFAHDLSGPPFGQGADNASGLRARFASTIRNNVFIGCGNAGISIVKDTERFVIDGNLFYLTPHDAVLSRGQNADITEQNLEELEDLGLKSAAGNQAGDPGLKGLRADWIDLYSRQLMSQYAKPPRETANAFRAAVGLPALAPSDWEKPEAQGALAPKLSPADVLAISLTAAAGAHSVELPVKIETRAAAAAPSYKRIAWSALAEPDAALANQRVELQAGLGQEQNSHLIKDLPPETTMGLRLYQPWTDEGSVFVLAKRYSLVQRQFEEAVKTNNGREIETTYFIRGIYRTDLDPSARQKMTILVESIVRAPLLSKPFSPLPSGRDWFVRAGSSGGDGTREKPFRDPFQALDKAEGGDAIHVAAGDYFGKLKSGQWKLLVRNLQLLGGYNAEFTERDPWKNPTRWVLSPEEKAKKQKQGTILKSEENSDGLVLDGFVFDGSTYNSYQPTGTLDMMQSPTEPLVELRGGQSPLTVRNCLFMNSGSEAVNLSCPFGVFENNVILNANRWALKINAGGPGPWTIRHNTFLFAGDPTPRAGTGQSAPDGTLLVLSGRADIAIVSNIFAFADNYGIRAALPQPNVSLTDNVFAANLFNHLTDAGYLWVDRSNWERRAVADAAFTSIKGNTLDLPALPVDPAFADVALARLFALPSRVSGEEWKTIAAQIGSSAKPAAPEAETAAASAPPPSKPAAGGPSLDELMAKLSGITAAAAKTAASTSTPPAAESVYCPAYDWKKALALVTEAAAGPGAHRQNLSLSFSPAQPPKAEIQYTPITPAQLDADLAALDQKPVEIEMTEARESSTNSSLYPSGMTKDNYSAYAASPVDYTGRTKLSLVVRHDTNVYKAVTRITRQDKLRVRGIARLLYPGALAIVIDSAEIAQQAGT